MTWYVAKLLDLDAFHVVFNGEKCIDYQFVRFDTNSPKW